MADYQTQIDEARRQGYADDEIIQYLRSQDPKVEQALKEGYSSQEIMQFLSPGGAGAAAAAPQERGTLGNIARFAGLAGKAAAPAAIGTTAGALMGAPAGPPGMAAGALIGGLAVPVADASVMAYNALMGGQARLPSDIIRNYLPGPTPETAGERVFSSGAEALLGTAPQVGAARVLASAGRPAAQAVGRVVGAEPTRQMIAAPAAGVAGQATVEATDSPLAGLAASTLTGGATGLKRRVREPVPSKETLQADYNARIQQLDKSNFQLVAKKAATEMDSRLQDLEKSGYDAELYPQVAVVIRRLTDDTPRTATRLQALRKMIQDLQATDNRAQRNIAAKMLSEYDDYLLNVPKDHIAAGRPEVLQAWKDSRPIFASIRKSEVFEKMLDDVQFTPGAKEKVLLSSLQKLAKDESEMRTFTKSEQEAIRKAAKSGSVNQALELMAKLTPNTFATVFYTIAGGYPGMGLAAAGTTARVLSGMGRQQQVNRLAEQMRLGRPPATIQGPFDAVPITAARGAMSSPYFQDPTNALVVE